MEQLLDALSMAFLVTGLLALVGDGYAMYWAGVEIKFKNKKWRVIFKTIPFLFIVFFTVVFLNKLK